MMKCFNPFLLPVLFIFALITEIPAQQVHQYTLTSGQSAKLEVDAGADITSVPGEKVMLGGDPVATGGTTPYNYYWEPSDSISEPEEATPEVTTGKTDITYTVTVIDDVGCTASEEITIFVEITALTLEKDNQFVVYPNPAHEQIIIKTNHQRGTLTLLNSQGKEILQKTLSNAEHRMDVSALDRGVYLLKVQTDQEEYAYRILIK